MTPEERPIFSDLMLQLAAPYGHPLSDMAIEGYWQDLAEYPLDDVQAAMRQARRESKFWPTIAYLRELLAGNPEDEARAAWAQVVGALARQGAYACVDFGDSLTHHVLAELWGGWPQVGPALGETPRERAFAERDFTKRYVAYVRNPPALPPPIAMLGLHAQQNAGMGGGWERGRGHADVVHELGPDGSTVATRALGAPRTTALAVRR